MAIDLDGKEANPPEVVRLAWGLGAMTVAAIFFGLAAIVVFGGSYWMTNAGSFRDRQKQRRHGKTHHPEPRGDARKGGMR
jgi:hypothetical protein